MNRGNVPVAKASEIRDREQVVMALVNHRGTVHAVNFQIQTYYAQLFPLEKENYAQMIPIIPNCLIVSCLTVSLCQFQISILFE